MMVYLQVSAFKACEYTFLTGRVSKVIEQYDDEAIRCPRVGGEVNFRFCRFENNMLPCRWIVGCWQHYIDINRFLADHYSNEDLAQIFAPPKSKVESLVNLVEKAKSRKIEK